jgi:Zn-finger nucleic acid-binding protein
MSSSMPEWRDDDRRYYDDDYKKKRKRSSFLGEILDF